MTAELRMNCERSQGNLLAEGDTDPGCLQISMEIFLLLKLKGASLKGVSSRKQSSSPYPFPFSLFYAIGDGLWNALAYLFRGKPEREVKSVLAVPSRREEREQKTSGSHSLKRVVERAYRTSREDA